MVLPDLAGTFPMRIGCPFCGMPQQRNGSAFPLHPNSHIVEEKGRRQPGTQSGEPIVQPGNTIVLCLKYLLIRRQEQDTLASSRHHVRVPSPENGWLAFPALSVRKSHLLVLSPLQTPVPVDVMHSAACYSNPPAAHPTAPDRSAAPRHDQRRNPAHRQLRSTPRCSRWPGRRSAPIEPAARPRQVTPRRG